MKTTIILIISFFLLGKAQAQISANSTNRATVADAVKIAFTLHAGMKEDDADEYLINHGINGYGYGTNGTLLIYRESAGDELGWTTSYPLQGNCSLGLEYRPAQVVTNWGSNGILQDAVISSNSVNIISIKFTNSPRKS